MSGGGSDVGVRRQWRGDRAQLVLWGALAIVTAFCYLFFLNAVPDFYAEQQNDPFTYISLAKSLAAGTGYPTKHWFPGFPAMLAPIVSVFGLNFVALKLAMVATSAVLALSCYRYFRSMVDASEARYLALLVAVVPTVFEYSHKLMAEIPSAAFAMLALAALEALRMTDLPRRATRWTIVLVLSCGVAVFMRGNALALVPALGVALAVERRSAAYRRRAATALVVAVAVFGIWMLRNRTVEFAGVDNVTYVQEVQAADISAVWRSGGFVNPATQKAGALDIARRAYRNIAWYQTYNIANCLFPGAGGLRELKTPGLGLGLAVLLALPVAMGLWDFLLLSPAGATYLLGSLALVLIYPTGGAPRMLIASIPVVVMAGYLGIRMIGGAEFAKGWVVTAACVGLFSCAIAGQRQRDHPYSFDGFATFVSLLGDADQRAAEPDRTLVSDYPWVVGALTALRAEDLAHAVGELKAGRAKAFLLVEGGPRVSTPAPTLPGDVVRSLLVDRGDFRLWRVALASTSSGP